MTRKRFSFFILLWIMLLGNLFANNLHFQNPIPIDNQTFSITIHWENAWKNSINYDAVWGFVKVRHKEGSWHHADIYSIEALSSKISTEVPADHKGFFVRSETEGIISQQLTIRLTEPYLTPSFEIQVMGIEMVWIPEAPFFLGDSIGTLHGFRRGENVGDSLNCLPYPIKSEEPISVGTKNEDLFGSPALDWTPQSNIPAHYPKGYEGFYLMKYEITQQQYVDFLNTLEVSQQKSRTEQSPTAPPFSSAMFSENALIFRNGIILLESAQFYQPAVYACDANGNKIPNEEGDGLHRACNGLNEEDILAYLDWAAMRPFTEMEFEKACRGTQKSIKGEFAWGTSESIDANSPLKDGYHDESVQEKAENTQGIASYNGGVDIPQLSGGLRNGFAAHQNSNRIQAGAGFYGVMEMSGNLWEMCVGTHQEALSFDGNYGDGSLNSEGKADAWATNLLRARGGAWNSFIYPVGEFRDLSISSRFFATLKLENRRNTTGGRGAR